MNPELDSLTARVQTLEKKLNQLQAGVFRDSRRGSRRERSTTAPFLNGPLR